MSLDWTITPINSSSFTEVKIPYHLGVPSVSGYVSDFQSYFLAKDINGTDQIPFPENTTLNIDALAPEDDELVVLYVKATSGTPNFILLANKRR